MSDGSQAGDAAAAAAAAALEALFTAVQQTRQVNYITMSAVTFLAYDICLMSPLEVKLIWRAKWSFPKLLYIFARYYGLCFLILELSVDSRVGLTVPFCQKYLYFFSLGGAILFTTTVNVILILRLYALFNRNKMVLLWLALVLIGEFVAELYISVLVSMTTKRTAFSAPPGIPFPGCLATAPETLTLVSWVPCLIAATMFFAMTLYSLYRAVKAKDNKFRWNFSVKTFSPLISTFYTDGAIYYSLIATILLISTVTTVSLSGPLANVGLAWLIAIYSYSGSRLILNLRRKALEQDSSATWDETISFRAQPGMNPNDTVSMNTFHAHQT